MWRFLVSSVRVRLGRTRRGLRRALQYPALDASDILNALRRLPFRHPRVLVVHSSLSHCGRIRGGTAAVITALRTWNPGGTLVMPTHSYCYPDGEGSAPVFDVTNTGSRVGAITDAFWRKHGVLRSLHPTHSLAGEGPAAAMLMEGHELCATPCGAGTPYERLVDIDAAILMFGVTLDACTLFHTAEDAAAVPYLYTPTSCALRMRRADGQVTGFTMKRQDMTVPRRFADMDCWLEERALLHRAPLGRGEIMFIPHAALMHQALTDALRADPWLLVQPQARQKARTS